MTASSPRLKAAPLPWAGSSEGPRRTPVLPALPAPSPLLFALAVALLGGAALGVAAARPGAVVGRPRLVLALLALPSLASAVALVRLEPPGIDLRLDPSTELLLPRSDPAREVYRDAVRQFGDDEVYVVAMETEEVFRPEALRALRRVTERLARLPEVRSARSLADVVAFRWDAEAEWLEVGRFLEEVPEAPAALEALRREALGHPLYRRTLVGPDGRAAAVDVTFRKMTDREFLASGLDDRIAALLAEESRPGLRFHVAGRAHVKARTYHHMLRDLQRLIPAALLVMALGLGVVFGTRRGVVLPLGLVCTATLWTFGAMAWLDRPLTVLSVLLAPLLVAIGSVYGVHVLTRYEEEVDAAPDARHAAERALRELRLPVLLAGATTMAGFGALGATDVPAVFEVGAFAAFGVLGITVLALLALPAALALLPLRHARSRRVSARVDAELGRALAAVADLAARRSGAVLLVFALLTAGSAALVPRIVVDTDMLSFFDEDAPVRLEFEAVNRLLAGAVPLYVALRGEPGAFREPEALRAVARIAEAAERIPGVGRAVSPVDTVRVLNRALARDDPAAARIPDTRGAVAELLFMAPKGHLDALTSVDHARANVVVRTGRVGTAEVRRVAAALEEAVAEARLPEGITASVTGNALLLARSADAIAAAQPRAVGIAAAVIFLLVFLAFRDARLAAVAMLPNLVPVALYFGLLGVGFAPLSLPTGLVASVALGIAVDDTVHFLVRYGGARREGLSPAAAAAHCGRRVGRPIAITSFMLMAGFGVVALSGFATLREFGILSAATMGACLATDLLLLPALLIRTRA